MLAVRIEQMLLKNIQRGIYPKGGRLPSVRKLAQQLEVDKNTVNQAYKALVKKGVLEAIRGSGTYVKEERPETAEQIDKDEWRAQLDHFLSQARHHFDQEEILQELLESIDRIYGKREARYAFLECNKMDLETLGAKLSRDVESRFEEILLLDFLAQPDEIAKRFDLIVTTYFHLGEVNGTLTSSLQEKIVGVHAIPTQDAVLNIARLNVQVIGVVADFPRAMDWLIHVVQTYHPNVTILQAPIHDEIRLQTVLKKSDAIVVTQSRRPLLLEGHSPQVPVIPVSLTIDRQSIDYLVDRVERLRNIHQSKLELDVA